MKPIFPNKKGLAEFIEFLNGKAQAPSQDTKTQLFSFIKKELHPTISRVFLKLTVVHLFAGALTLVFCPQLGFSLYSNGMGLMGYFMHFGDIGCALLCGSLFLGTSMGVAAFLLSPEEIRVAQKARIRNITVLASLSYGLLMLMGGEIEFTYSLFWLLGGIIGGSSTLTWIPNVKKQLFIILK